MGERGKPPYAQDAAMEGRREGTGKSGSMHDTAWHGRTTHGLATAKAVHACVFCGDARFGVTGMADMSFQAARM